MYCRGILVKRLEESSLYDWNFEHVKLNRDRNIPDSWDLRRRMSKAIDVACLQEKGEQISRAILRSPNSLEAKSWATRFPSDEAAGVFAEAFRSLYGDNACTSVGRQSQNSEAEARGHAVVPLPKDLVDVVSQGGIKNAGEVVPRTSHLTLVPTQFYADFENEFNELRHVLDVIGCGAGGISIFIFEPHASTLGSYDAHGIWLSRKLFEPGARFERLRTLLHELGHSKGGDDETRTFENSLDWIAGKLAEKLLDERAVAKGPTQS